MSGLAGVELCAADGARAHVYQHGAHVSSWRPAPHGEERLYLSRRSALEPRQAIRGGIPVIFPQFAMEGPLPRHGFARTALWTLGATERTGSGEHVVRLSLTDSDETRAVWPLSFHATLTVRVGGPRLSVTLEVENRDRVPMAFTAALHTYLRVRDVSKVLVEGLAGTLFRESSAPGVLRREDSEPLRIAGEVDRVYVSVQRPIVVRDGDRTMRVESSGFTDAVLWNPGAARAAALADLDPGGEREMLCVEAGAIQSPVELAPAARFTGTQTLVAEAGQPER